LDKFLVPDASPLIALQKLSLIHLFFECSTKNGWKIIITRPVYIEIIKPPELKEVVEEKISKGEIVLVNNYDPEILTLAFPSLGPGEASILLLSQDDPYMRNKTILIIDDKLARSIANNNGCNLTGTIGIINALKKRGYLSAEKTEWIKKTLPSIIYCSPELVKELDE